MKIRKSNCIFFLLFVFVVIFFSTSIYAKDLVYESKVSIDSDSGDKFLNFRKYVRAYGSPADKSLTETSDYLYNQSTSTAGSYVTQAMIFHMGYGTNYNQGTKDLADGTHEELTLNYDKNSVNIDTDENLNWNFFNHYGIYGDSVNITVQMPSNKDSIVSGAQSIYKTSNVRVWRSGYKDKMAITDFRLDPDEFTMLVGNIKDKNIAIDNGFYRIRVSGSLQVVAMNNAGGKRNYFFKYRNSPRIV